MRKCAYIQMYEKRKGLPSLAGFIVMLKYHELYFVMLTANADTLVKRSEERDRIDDTKDILFTRMCKFSEELLDIICNVTLHGHQMKKIDTGNMSVEDEVKFIKEIVGMER